MNTIIKNIDITTKKPVIIVPLSDVHVGHVDHDKKLFLDTVKWIKDNDAYTILLGDMIDAISQQDKRYENDSIAPEFKDHLDNLHYRQTEVFLEGIMPIKDRVIGVMGGNHEQKVKKMFSYDATSVIAQKLEVPILTDPGYVIIRFKNGGSSRFYKILCSHGVWMGGRKRGAKINNMEDKMADFEFDAILAGHTHDKWSSARKRVDISQVGKQITKRKEFVNTGGFMPAYGENNKDTWASRSLFPPQIAGVVRMDFYLKRKDGVRYIDVHTRI